MWDIYLYRKMTTTYFKLYLFILGDGKKLVVDMFLEWFCVPEGCSLFTFWGKEVYIKGVTCVGIGGKRCTFWGMPLTLKVHKDTKV